jgi:hypothetical protein
LGDLLQLFNIEKIKDSKNSIFEIPPDATNSLYVDGVPNDASEREISRKLFIIC